MTYFFGINKNLGCLHMFLVSWSGSLSEGSSAFLCVPPALSNSGKQLESIGEFAGRSSGSVGTAVCDETCLFFEGCDVRHGVCETLGRSEEGAAEESESSDSLEGLLLHGRYSSSEAGGSVCFERRKGVAGGGIMTVGRGRG